MSTFMTLQDPHTLQSYQVFVHRHVARCKKVTDLSFQSHLKIEGTRTLSIFLMTPLENFYFILCKTTRDEGHPPPKKIF